MESLMVADMTNDEIQGRLAALEVFTLTAFGLYLANSRNDPENRRALALLEHTRAAVSSLAVALPPLAQKAANEYADHLVSTLANNLRNLKGESGPSR